MSYTCVSVDKMEWAEANKQDPYTPSDHGKDYRNYQSVNLNNLNKYCFDKVYNGSMYDTKAHAKSGLTKQDQRFTVT